MEKHIYRYSFKKDNILKCEKLEIVDAFKEHFVVAENDLYCQTYSLLDVEKILPNNIFLSFTQLSVLEENKVLLHFLYCKTNKLKQDFIKAKEEWNQKINRIIKILKILKNR